MNVGVERIHPAQNRGLIASTAALTVALLVGCSGAADKPAASQVAAKVNAQELTIHQVNVLLERQPATDAATADAARKQALDRLITQELALQKAAELKLDRDPRIMQLIEASRRDVIARAYFERVGEGAGTPTDTEVQKYYADHTDLFAQRRVYQLQEWLIQMPVENLAEVRQLATSAKSANDFTDYLKARSLKFEFNHAIRTAEQLPLNSLSALGKMQEGDVMVNDKPHGLQVVRIVTSRIEPVEIDQVRPMIEQFLLNERKGRLVADDLKALRNAATIQYVGLPTDSPADAASSPSAAAPASAPLAGLNGTAIESLK